MIECGPTENENSYKPPLERVNLSTRFGNEPADEIESDEQNPLPRNPYDIDIEDDEQEDDEYDSDLN